ncbi:Plasma-membrane_choline transporter domain-containing protein [Hexamita inflata]|uniref:Plasma-membrane choline transporter domain-containing protein n=1 Tax=Hexamita inflata TaxID=28002 RepID=A0AA86PSM9_9EUKA|nr:Plasma-membrane choline transporter domain-containing protein [Hexamita inflata]
MKNQSKNSEQVRSIKPQSTSKQESQKHSVIRAHDFGSVTVTKALPKNASKKGDPVADARKSLARKWKCTDWWCVLVYLGCWFLTILFAFILPKTKVSNFVEQSKNYFETTDNLRRICGNKADDQDDKNSTDYSSIINSYQQSYAFCEMMTLMKEAKNTPNNIYNFSTVTDFALLDNFDCKTLVKNQKIEVNTTITQEMYDTQASYLFYSKMSKLYKEAEQYDLGYVLDKTICVSSKAVELDNQDLLCIPKLTSMATAASYLCNHEIVDIIKFVLYNQNSPKLQDLQAQMKIIINVTSTQVENEPIFHYTIQQFMGDDFYNALFTVLNALDSRYLFAKNFCFQMPVLLNQYSIYQPETIKANVAVKCMLNFATATSNAVNSTEFVLIWINYLSSVLSQPLQSAVQELDLSWFNLVFAVVSTIIMLVIYQLLLLFLPKLLIFTSTVLMVGALAYYTFKAFGYASSLKAYNAEYLSTYGSINMENQLEEIGFYIGGAFLILGVIMMFFMVFLLLALANAIKATVQVAKKAISKMLSIMIVPFVMVSIAIAQLGFFIAIIFLHSSSGQFNAKVISFNHITPGMTFLMVFYIFMAVHGLFLVVIATDYIVGCATIQYYFKRTNKRTSNFVIIGIKNMFAQFGSLCLEAFFYMFMIWFRPIFGLICAKMKEPKTKTMIKIKDFSEAYVSFNDLKTTFGMSLYGLPLLKAAKKVREIEEEEENIVGEAMGEIQDTFLDIGDTVIGVATNFLIMAAAKMGFPQIDDVKYIFIQLMSFIIGLLIASIVTELTDNIVKAIIFCFSLEAEVGKFDAAPTEFLDLQKYNKKSNNDDEDESFDFDDDDDDDDDDDQDGLLKSSASIPKM